MGFHALLWENSAGSLRTWVSMCCSGKTLLARFAVAWHHRRAVLESRGWCWVCVEMKASLRCWFRDVTALAWSWTSSDGWFSRRASSGPASRPTLRALEGEAREFRSTRKSYKRANCTLARCFKQSDLALPTGGWSNQSVCMRRSPAHVHGFLGLNPRDPIFHSFRGRYKLTDFIYV